MTDKDWITRYLCERCGGSGVQPAGKYWHPTHKAYLPRPEGQCELCGGSGFLGMTTPIVLDRELTAEEAAKLHSGPEKNVGCLKKSIAAVAVLIVAAFVVLGVGIVWAMYELTIQNRPDRPAVEQTANQED